MKLTKLFLYWLTLSWLLCATGDVYAQGTPFTFTLDEPCKTSAGVFAPDGTLIRTLWSKVRYYAPGTYSSVWDGLDDHSNAAPAGVYQIKLLQHNTEYVWDGVAGNTSAEISGPTVHSGFWPMADMAISGTNAFYVSGYDEGKYDFRNFLTTDPQHVKMAWYWVYSAQFNRMNSMPGDINDLNWLWVAADANWVYFACSGTPNPNNLSVPYAYPGCIVACNVADNSPAFFSSGVQILNNGANSPLPNGIYVGTQPGLSGLTVQPNGRLLAVSVAPDNQVYLIDKTAGTAVASFNVSSPQRLSFSPDGSLWVISGSNVICYTNLNTSPTAALTISGLSEPLDVAVCPTNASLILVADGGGSQQVKAFSNAGAPLWSYGLSGGYQANGSTVATNKFWFTERQVDSTFLCFAPDGSFWVGDGGNFRSMHFSAARDYIEQIMYQPHSYVAAVDQNNPCRVFNQFLEFSVDYTKPLPEAWSLVKNWKVNVPAVNISWNGGAYDNEGLYEVTTFSNGRTYALVDNNTYTFAMSELCELATNQLRLTGLYPAYGANRGWISLGPDGSARRTTIGAPSWFEDTLTGFDASNNPTWTPDSLIGSASNGSTDPVPRDSSFGNVRAPISSNNILISFDQSLNNGWHLGGLRVGSTRWLWEASPAVGIMNGCGTYEISNGVTYAGNTVQAVDRNVIYGYHGEFFRGQGQAGQTMHFYDDGLFVGQFGEASPGHSAYEGALPGFAGNGHSPSLVKTSTGDFYLWVNDESDHGPQRWHFANARNIREQSGSGTLGSAISLTSQDYGFPTGVTGKNGNQTAELSWLPVPGAASYNIRYSLLNGGPYSILAGNTTTLDYVVGGLTNGQTYYFVVTAVQGGSEGIPSEQVSINPFDTTQNVLATGSMSEGGQFTPVVEISSAAPASGQPSYIGAEHYTGVLNLRELDDYGFGNLQNEIVGAQGYAIYDWQGAGSNLVNLAAPFTVTPGSGWNDIAYLERQYRVDNVLGVNNGLTANPAASINIGVSDTNFHYLTVISPAQFNYGRQCTIQLTSASGASAVYTVNENPGLSHVFQFLFKGNVTLWARSTAPGTSNAIVQALFLDNAAVTYLPPSSSAPSLTGSTTVLTSSQNPAVANSLVSLISTTSGIGGIPTGNATFFDGSSYLGTAALNSSGIATFNTTSLSVGGSPHSITAVYSGDSVFAASTSSALSEVINNSTNAGSGQTYADLTNGLVAYYPLAINGVDAWAGNNLTLLGSPIFSSNAVNWNGAVPTLGYGSPQQWPQSGLTVSAWINMDDPTANYILACCYGAPSGSLKEAYMQFFTYSNGLTARVIQNIDADFIGRSTPAVLTTGWHFAAFTWSGGTASSSIKIYLDGVEMDNTNANDGTFTGPYSGSDLPLALGTQFSDGWGLAGGFYGNEKEVTMYNRALSGTEIGLLYNNGISGGAASATTVASSQNPSQAGSVVTFTATVSGNGGTPTGSVAFLDGSTSLGTGTLDGSGVATLSTTGLSSAGPSHSITAVYSGNLVFAGSTSAVLSQTILSPSTTVIASSQNPAPAGSLVTFTATVTGNSSGGNFVSHYITNGLVEWNKFNDGAGAIAADSSTNGNTIPLIGSPSWGSNYLILNGLNQYGDAGSAQLTSLDRHDMTICAWINKTGSSQKGIVDKSFDTGGGYGGWSFQVLGDNRLDWWVEDGLDLQDNGGATVNLGQWTFATVVWHYATHAADFYINGALNSQVQNGAPIENPSGSADLEVGNMRNNASGGAYAFDGSMHDIGVYNRALSAAEVETNYLTSEFNTNVSIPDLLYYEMTNYPQSNSPVFFTDSSTHGGTTGTEFLIGGIHWVTNVVPNNAIHFNGANSYLDTSNSVLFNFTTNLFTINFWIRPLTANGYVMENGMQAVNGWYVQVGGSYQIYFGTETNGTDAGIITAPGAAQEGVWDMVTIVRTGQNSATIYINGLQATSGYITSPAPSTNSLIIGVDRGGGHFLDGDFWLPQIWGEALPPTSIATLYFMQSSGYPWPVAAGPITAGTVAFYNGSTELGTGSLNGSGLASFSTTALSSGGSPYSITAVFGGNSTSTGSTSSVLSQVIANSGNTASTSTQISSSQNPALAGGLVTFTATVSAGAGTPAGSVSFFDGSTNIGAGTLNGSGVATFGTAALSAGGSPHSITAVYGGNSSFAASGSSLLSQVILNTSTTALASSQNPALVGSLVTFTATVGGSGGIPAGTVTFFDGSTNEGSGTLSGSGVATFSTTALSAGGSAHSITAVYSGNSAYAGSTSAPLSQVILKPSSTSVVSSQSPASIGSTVTFTATVSGSGGIPSGTVNFFDGSTNLGSGSLNNSGNTPFGIATLSVAGSPHAITAVYGGDNFFAGSTSSAISQIIVNLTNGLVAYYPLAVNGNDAWAGNNLTLVGAPAFSSNAIDWNGAVPTMGYNSPQQWPQSGLTVSAWINMADPTANYIVAACYGAPSGTLQAAYMQFFTYYSGLTARVVQNIDANFIARSTPAVLTTGWHFAAFTWSGGTTSSSIKVYLDGVEMDNANASSGAFTGPYSGNNLSFTMGAQFSDGYGISGKFYGNEKKVAMYNRALSATEIGALYTIGIPGGIPSTTTITSSQNPAAIGSAVTFTATVSGSGGTPSGNVTFLDGSTSLGTGTLNGSGVATFSTTGLSPAGSPHSITAVYGGNISFVGSTSSALSQIILSPSTTAIASSQNPALVGSSVTFTATVSGGGGTPTGTVSFFDGSTNLGAGTLSGSDVATFSTSGLSLGGSPHSITAGYSGDSVFAGSTSGVLSEFISSSTNNTNGINLTNGLVAYYPLAVNGNDAWAGNNLTLVGSPTFSSSAINWNGAVPTLGYNSPQQWPQSGLTVSAWINMTDPTANYILAACYGAPSGTLQAAYMQFFTYSSGLTARVIQNIDANFIGRSTPAVLTSGWHFAAFTWSGGTSSSSIKVYLDGAEVDNTSANSGTFTGPYSGNNLSLTMGAQFSDGYGISGKFYGGEKEVAMYNRALSATEIEALYTGGIPTGNGSTTTIASSLNPAGAGSTVTFTATVSGSGGTPSGNVTFLDGSTSLGTGTLNGSGVATFSTTGLSPAGSPHSITAVYGGNISFVGSTSSALSQIILSPSTTAIASSQNPALVGSSVTFTATVSGGGGTPTGTVSFFDGSTNLGAGTLNGSDMATFGASGLSLGGSPHSITAAYSGDTVFAASTSAVLSEVIASSTNNTNGINLTNGLVAYYPLALNGNDAWAGNNLTLVGAPIFSSNAINWNGAVPTMGYNTPQQWPQSGLTVSAWINMADPTANYIIAACYGAPSGALQAAYLQFFTYSSGLTARVIQNIDANFIGRSTPAVLTSGWHFAAFTWSGGPSSSSIKVYLDGVEMDNANASSGTFTGPYPGNNLPFTLGAQFSDGYGISGKFYGSEKEVSMYNRALSATEIAALYTGGIPAGTPTATTLGSSQNPAQSGSLVTFTATVSGSGGIPAGSVAFFDGITSLGAASLNGSGVATFSTGTLSAGGSPHSITAAYSGSVAFAGSTSSVLSELITNSAALMTIPLVNPSFESPAGAQGTVAGQPTGWLASNQDPYGVWNPPAGVYTNQVNDILPSPAQGSQVLWIQAGNYIVQFLTNTLAGNQTYTLSGAIGNRGDGYGEAASDQVYVNLLAGNTIVAQNVNLTHPAPGGFLPWSITYTSPATGFPTGPLQIRLGQNGTGQVHFDNIILTVAPASP